MHFNCWCIPAFSPNQQVIESGVAGLVGTLWSGARAAAREARELAAALELEKAGRRAASMLDSGIEVRACIQGLQGQVLVRAAVIHRYLSSAYACSGKRTRHEAAGKVVHAVARAGVLTRMRLRADVWRDRHQPAGRAL